MNLSFSYIGQVSLNDHDLNSQSIVADFSEKSMQTVSGTSIKTLQESPAKAEMRKYIRQMLNDELESQQIKEKLMIQLDWNRILFCFLKKINFNFDINLDTNLYKNKILENTINLVFIEIRFFKIVKL